MVDLDSCRGLVTWFSRVLAGRMGNLGRTKYLLMIKEWENRVHIMAESKVFS